MGILKEGFSAYSSLVMLISRKLTKDKRVVTDFRHLNVRIAKNNLAYPLVRDMFSVLGNSKCEVLSVLRILRLLLTLIERQNLRESDKEPASQTRAGVRPTVASTADSKSTTVAVTGSANPTTAVTGGVNPRAGSYAAELQRVTDALSSNFGTLPKGTIKSADQRMNKEAYDLVLDYLLSEGHVDTVEEAHYVMLQMTSEHVQDIVEGKYADSVTYVKGTAPVRASYGGKPESFTKETYKKKGKV